MKALTLYQPWATLIAIGAKKIETRSWGTNYRGPLAIHAGKNREWEYLINETPFYKALSTHPTVWHMQPPIPWGDYTIGRYMWKLEHVKILPEPIPAKGFQGLWDWKEGQDAPSH